MKGRKTMKMFFIFSKERIWRERENFRNVIKNKKTKQNKKKQNEYHPIK